nr:GAF domain-containing protein [Desulfobacula sp.]
MKLRTKIIISVVMACSIINFFLCFYFTEKIKTLELANLYQRIEKSVSMMALVNSRPLYNVDKETLRANMEIFFEDENMKRISLSEKGIDVDIRLEREFTAKRGVDIEKRVDIHHQGLRLGSMTAVYSTGRIEETLGRFRIQMLSFTFTVITGLILVLIALVNKHTQPVTDLAKAASEIAAGNLDRDIEQGGVGEVGDLSRNFAAMRDVIKEKINDLARTNHNLEKELVQKEVNEKKILRQSRIISSVNTFFQKSMSAGTYEEVAKIFIPIALDVVSGRYCLIGEVTKENPDLMDILAVSDEAVKDCRMDEMEKKARFRGQEIPGIGSCVIHLNKTLISNEAGTHPDFSNLPENHIPIDTFLCVPMTLGSEIKGIIAFAGKKGGYDEDDRAACEMLAAALAEALSLKKKEDEKKNLEEMMVQSEKMVSIGGLAAGMAHEINNPLAGILQNTQVIRNRLKEKLPANVSAAGEFGLDLDGIQAYMEKREIFKMIDSVLDAGKRAAAIVSNMLSFSRKSSSSFMPEDVCELLDKTLELAESDYSLKKKFDFKKIRVIKEYGPGIPKIRCKSSEIQQVFFNILSNGAQAMISWEQLPDPCFILKIYRQETGVGIEISDNGPGMKEEIRKRVFEPFFTTKVVGEGTGLGLAVSYFIVTENHKGQIEVSSKPLMGTKFTILLPLEGMELR